MLLKPICLSKQNTMVITYTELTNVLIEHGLKEDIAKEYAQRTLNFFGFQTHIIDNVLEPVAHPGGERDTFYWLEEEDILARKVEEINLPLPKKNKPWRIFSWYFRSDWNKPKKKSLEAPKQPEQAYSLETECYLNGKVPEEVWAKHAAMVGVQTIDL
jgi:hypothetical protein